MPSRSCSSSRRPRGSCEHHDHDHAVRRHRHGDRGRHLLPSPDVWPGQDRRSFTAAEARGIAAKLVRAAELVEAEEGEPSEVRPGQLLTRMIDPLIG